MKSQNVSNDVRKGHSGETPAGRITKLPTIEIPNRYSIRKIGSEKGLSCVEAPNLAVYIKFGLCIPTSAVNKAAPGTIYLDGVAQCGPLLDHSKQVYNFDHHEGCVRLFTLSTCEQTLLMIKKGLDLRSREWKIYANDPDIDTILAVWLLLNHIRINEQESIRENILFPLVRLQGSIDSLGLEMKMMTGLPPILLNQCQRIIDHLRRKEIQLKKDGLWEETDFLDYTADILYEIDQIVYESKKLGKSLGVEELARVTLPGNRVAVVLQSDMGIYEIEPHLKKIYGGNIGLVILRRARTAYTLRQVDPFLKGNLEDVYEKLNFIDPAVKYRNMNNKWGGSSDIGGSPRGRGTQLTPENIAKACLETFQKYSFFQKMRQYALAVLSCIVVFSAAFFSAAYWGTGKWFNKPGLDAIVSDPYFGFGVVMLLLTSLILVSVSRRRLWQFGIILPEGKKWWFFLPVTVLIGFIGGAWVPAGHPSLPAFNDSRLLLICVLLPFVAEYLFRGVLHGMIAQQSKIQSSVSNYFISWPNLGTSFLYSLFLTFFPVFQDGAFNLSMNFRSGWIYFTAFIFSISLGFVRERSHSFLTSYLFHLISVFLCVFLPSILMHANQILNIIRSVIPL
jgi:membrane protease YdiL (CAAX protease family)